MYGYVSSLEGRALLPKASISVSPHIRCVVERNPMCRKSFAMLWSNPRCQVCRFRGEDDECFRGMWGGHTSGVCVCVCPQTQDASHHQDFYLYNIFIIFLQYVFSMGSRDNPNHTHSGLKS